MSMRQLLQETRRIARSTIGPPSRRLPRSAIRGGIVEFPRSRTGVHGGVLGLALAVVGGFIAAIWFTFNLNWESLQNLLVVISFILTFCVLFGGLAWRAARDPRWTGRHVDFATFLNSQVDLATGPVKGREVLWTVLLLPLALALGMLAIGIVLRFIA